MDHGLVRQQGQDGVGSQLIAVFSYRKLQQVAARRRTAAAEHMTRCIRNVHDVIVVESTFYATQAHCQK